MARVNRRMALAILNVTAVKFARLIEDGKIPAGVGLGPRSLTWDQEELIAIRDGKVRLQGGGQSPASQAA